LVCHRCERKGFTNMQAAQQGYHITSLAAALHRTGLS
jgi:hypothetical protein